VQLRTLRKAPPRRSASVRPEQLGQIKPGVDIARALDLRGPEPCAPEMRRESALASASVGCGATTVRVSRPSPTRSTGGG